MSRPTEPIAVPALDLKAQYQTIREEIEGTLRSVIENQAFILGPEVSAFEAETPKRSCWAAMRAFTILETDCGCRRPPIAPPLLMRRKTGAPGSIPAIATQASIALTASLFSARGTATLCGLPKLVFDLANVTSIVLAVMRSTPSPLPPAYPGRG